MRLCTFRKTTWVHIRIGSFCYAFVYPDTFACRNLRQKFTKRSQVSKYETRRANDLQVPRPRLEITKKSFSYKSAKVWNDVPNNIRNVESAALFKKQARSYFLGQ